MCILHGQIVHFVCNLTFSASLMSAVLVMGITNDAIISRHLLTREELSLVLVYNGVT